MKREIRTFHNVEIRAIEENGIKSVKLEVVTPEIVDEYGSVFLPECFDRSLRERWPTLAWCHRWDEPIGRAFEYVREGSAGAEVNFRLDDFDDVPMARRAYAQVQPGPNGEPATIDDCSVGFSNTTRRQPTDEDLIRWPGCREVIEDADLDEVSLVLRGAVPGAKVLASRSADGATVTVDADAVVELARKIAAGDMTEEEGQIALTLLAGAAPAAPETDPADEPPAAEIDDAGLDIEADAALESLLGI